MVSQAEEGGPKESRDIENDTIISDLTLRNIIPTQIKNMTWQYKFMCGCECCIYYKSMHESLLS